MKSRRYLYGHYVQNPIEFSKYFISNENKPSEFVQDKKMALQVSEIEWSDTIWNLQAIAHAYKEKIPANKSTKAPDQYIAEELALLQKKKKMNQAEVAPLNLVHTPKHHVHSIFYDVSLSPSPRKANESALEEISDTTPLAQIYHREDNNQSGCCPWLKKWGIS